MKYENHKASGIRLAYIGGGSRGWVMTDLAIEPDLSGEVVLYDIDCPAPLTRWKWTSICRSG